MKYRELKDVLPSSRVINYNIIRDYFVEKTHRKFHPSGSLMKWKIHVVIRGLTKETPTKIVQTELKLQGTDTEVYPMKNKKRRKNFPLLRVKYKLKK